MGIPDRLYNIAKSQLARAKDQWDTIDSQAQRELDSFVANHSDTTSQSAWDRAAAKINAAKAQGVLAPTGSGVDVHAENAAVELQALEDKLQRNPASPSVTEQAAQTVPAETIHAAYQLLGVPPGADWPTVQTAYRKLKERAAPERFPEGSPERESAHQIQRRIENAYLILSDKLAPKSDRFDRLEF